MKIIDNPAVGIGFLLCIGLAVLGFSLLPNAEGQQSSGYHANLMVTGDESPDRVISRQTPAYSMATTDEDNPFAEDVVISQPLRSRRNVRTQAVESPQSVRIVRVPKTAASTTPPSDADPFADTVESQPFTEAVKSAGLAVRGPIFITDLNSSQRKLSPEEKRDTLLHRIVLLRLQRSEFEKLPPIVSQMQNPETAIEMMLEFVEQSDQPDNESIGKLLDVITALTLQMGQPKQMPVTQLHHLHGDMRHSGIILTPQPLNGLFFSGQPADPSSVVFSHSTMESNTPLPFASVPENVLRQQSQVLNTDVLAGPVSAQVLTVVEGAVSAESVSAKDQADTKEK